jgi:phosphohistidine phosphatase SixA
VPRHLSGMRILVLLLALIIPLGGARASSDQAAWDALRGGAIVLFRHALAPGTGDPANMRVGDCATQRNLSEDGREQARRIGERLRAERVAIGRLLHSRWCRAADTARLMGGMEPRPEPAFDSFFGNRTEEPEKTAAALRLLRSWQGPGALVVSTHQVNITALTGIVPASGEGIVVRVVDGRVSVVGRIKP